MNLGGLIFLYVVLSFVVAIAFGRAMHRQRDVRAENAARIASGERALAIADAWRELGRVTALDGEAWTYEHAARYWEERAAALGVVRPTNAQQSMRGAQRTPSVWADPVPVYEDDVSP